MFRAWSGPRAVRLWRRTGSGAPRRSRISNLLIRSQGHFPVVLWVHEEVRAETREPLRAGGLGRVPVGSTLVGCLLRGGLPAGNGGVCLTVLPTLLALRTRLHRPGDIRRFWGRCAFDEEDHGRLLLLPGSIATVLVNWQGQDAKYLDFVAPGVPVLYTFPGEKLDST